MPLARDLRGFSAGQALALGGSVNTGISTAGSTLGTATALTASVNLIGTNSAATQGVSLNDMNVGESQEVYNGTATSCLVYPPTSSDQINQIAAGSAMILPQYTAVVIKRMTTTRFVAYMSS